MYGSDAVAGVVNFILKKKFEGTQLNVRVGGTEQGGGQNQRLQVVSGHSSDRFDAVYGVELSHRQAIWGDQRDFMNWSLCSLRPGILATVRVAGVKSR